MNLHAKILGLVLSLLLSLPPCAAVGKDGGTLPVFSRLTTADGLRDDAILHILPLADGRMVVTSDSCVTLCDGVTYRSYAVTPHEVYRIANYRGAYHTYVDSDDRLWVKEWGNVWCMDLNTGRYVDLSHRRMDDLFVDSRHRLWVVADSMIGATVDGRRVEVPAGGMNAALQDMDADSLRLYLFFADGRLACFDLHDGRCLYVAAAYSSEVADDYAATSLVVRGAEGDFYQLRTGRRNIFLRFNPRNRQWTTIFDTATGSFHSLCVPDTSQAWIGCPKGIWIIRLATGEMTLHTDFETADGQTLQTGINAIVRDRDGGLWLGTYGSGILRASSLYAAPSYTLYILVGLLALVAAVLALLFWRITLRQRRRERHLMKRLHELILSSSPVQEQDGADDGGGTLPMDSPENEVDMPESSDGIAGEAAGQQNEFIARAVAEVERHLSTPNYTVERLAADLCMERTGLYKKLKALLDQSPNLFIRRIRLEHAARLLRAGGHSVADVAGEVGFSSVAYFSRLFQEAFGVKPQDYHG